VPVFDTRYAGAVVSNAMPLVLVTLLAAPVLNLQAVAAGVPTPIALESCSAGFPMIARNGRQVYDLRVRFINRSSERISQVRFTTTIDGRVVEVVDAGAFDAGVEIAHGFRQVLDFTVAQPAPPTSCAISFVRFSDGSTWPLPQPPPGR
jgi:hypothetical protein